MRPWHFSVRRLERILRLVGNLVLGSRVNGFAAHLPHLWKFCGVRVLVSKTKGKLGWSLRTQPLTYINIAI